MTEPWVSVDVIAEHLGVMKDSLNAWTTTRDMPAHRAGHVEEFKVAEVDEWVRSSGAAGTGSTDTGGA